MKARRIILIVTGMLSFLLSGCESYFFPVAKEIEKFQVVQVAGIDKSAENPDHVEITFITQLRQKSSNETGAGSRIATVLSSSGPTVFDAERRIKSSTGKTIFLAHVNFILIGEEAAREDFTKYFDFIKRDHETRLSPKVYIIRGASAKEFISTTSSEDMMITDRLEDIKADIRNLSETDEVSMIDVSAMLDRSDTATIIPALECRPIENEQSTGQLPENKIVTAGYAVIKDFQLVGYLDASCARGYNFITNKVGSCPVNVTDSSGLPVALEVISSKTKVIAHFNGNELTGVTYKTHVTSNIPEQQTRNDITSKQSLQELSAKQSEIIRDEMEQVIRASQEYGTDCTRLGQAISLRYPFKWDHLRSRWGELYPELSIEIIVESDIARSYDIREPNGYQTGD